MATLADINSTLQEQNKFLESVQQNTEENKDSVERLVERLTGINQKEKELEAQRKSKSKPAGPSKLVQLGAVTGIPGLAGLMGMVSGGGLISALLGGLKLAGKGGLLTLAGTALASAVGAYIESEDGNKELADAARRAIQVGFIASIFGFRFGLIGAAIAAVLDEESAKKIKAIGEEIAGKLPFLATLFEDLGIYVPSLSDVTQTVNRGLDGLLGFMQGDMTKFIDNFGALQTSVGGLLLLFPKTRLIGAALIGLGLAFDAVADELGSFTAILLQGLASFGLAAFLYRKKIAEFLKRRGPQTLDDDLKTKKKEPTKLNEQGKPLKTQAELYEEKINKQEKGFRNRMRNLFKDLKLPGVPRFGPALAVSTIAAGAYDAATEDDPNLYGFGDLYRDLSTPFIDLHNYLMGEQEKVESVNENILRVLQGMREQRPGFEDAPKLTGKVLNEYEEFYGPAGATSTPVGTGTVLAPQVDARSTSIDQSQAALITTDQHIRSEDPRGQVLYDY